MSYNPFRPDDAPDIRDEDRKRWNAQQSADPRTKQPKHRARLALYEDSEPTLRERGARLNHFLEPEGK